MLSWSAVASVVVAIFYVLTLAPVTRAATTEPIGNAGFARGNIIFSKDPFFAGDKVRIYTIIFNGSDGDLSGAVEFFADSASIGKTDFSVKGGGTIRDVWTDWTATVGDHKITAKIVNARVSFAGSAPYAVVLEMAESGAVQVTVDQDTDHDGTPDKTDPDMDGDGLANIVEIEQGYDPLKKDSDGDGVSDRAEYEAMIKVAVPAEKWYPISIASGTESVVRIAVDSIKNAVGSTTAVLAREYADGVGGFAESARRSAADWAGKNATSLRKELNRDAVTNVEISSGDESKIKTAVKDFSSPERPIKYALMLATGALHFILTNKWLTYFLLSFAIYLALKVLYRYR